MQFSRYLTLLWLTVFSFSLHAADRPETSPAIATDSLNYLAKIELHTPEEIAELFERASKLLEGENGYSLGSPIAFVLHGPEVEYFAKMNYPEFKSIVDKAAQLDAFRVIDVRVCNTYLRIHNIDRSALPPFVEIVPYGPAEEKKLKEKGYVDF
ncbi:MULTISPECIES: hypothetical protein [unclassified Hahella]|uniref:DsrE family protein n=1 Tax=unclassified Hahella TaxID=2624107 RepID=UPI001C1F0EE5|nr:MULTISPECIES: hypothetical protein [unclassified Hahella]MBU6955445.1 hypothetical protein [Hahella sp. HN01]MDG9667199.1 hypothetical protein [Hahella sp. CR1]